MILKEIFNSLKNAISERLTNPIIGSFLISWLIINWDIIILLLTKKNNLHDATNVILKIQQKNPFDLYLIPFSMSLLYVFGGPWISLYVNKFREKPIQNAREDKIRIETAHQLNRIELFEAQAKLEVAKNKILLEHKQAELDVEQRELDIKTQREDIDKQLQEIKDKEDNLLRLQKEIENGKNQISVENDHSTFSENENKDFGDIENIQNIILSKIEESINNNEKPIEIFTIKELVPRDIWENIPVKDRKILGKEFHKRVSRGDFINIYPHSKNSANQQQYIVQDSRNVSTLNTSLNKKNQTSYSLSDESKKLLKEAATNGQGVIMKVEHLGGRSIQVGQESFGGKPGRESAKWEEALNQLINLKFVTARGPKGQMFELTNLGWSEADKI